MNIKWADWSDKYCLVMNIKWIPEKRELSSVRPECSAAALSERLSEHPLSFAEIVELSEKCDLWEIEKQRKTFSRPVTFVPASRVVASFSRIVE
jgi:hypothetical protein